MSVPARPARPPGPGYLPVLALLFLIPVAGALASLAAGTLIAAALIVVVWLAVARASMSSVQVTRAGTAVAVLLMALTVAAVALDRDGALAIVQIGAAVAIGGVVTVVVRDLFRHRVVTLSTVAGALSIYLMIGLLFASAYQAAELVSDDAFASSVASPRGFDLVYFSFVTLTTLGYGDITPALDATRALAILEAVIGQLFLVTVVARTVAMLGSERPRRGGVGV